MSIFLNELTYDQLLDKYRIVRATKDKEDGIITPNSGLGHAVGYTRVSTIMQVEDGSSLESQKQSIQLYCKNKNLILDAIYEEPAKSGSDTLRPQLLEMIDNLISGTKIVCTAIDRLSRDTNHLLSIKSTVHNKQCSIYFIDRGLDTVDASTELLITIMAAIATEGRKSQNRLISTVMQDMSRRSTLHRKPKYGWKYVDGVLMREENEQIVIEIIKRMIASDNLISVAAIRQHLEVNRITIRKCKKLYPTSINNIIRDNNLRPPSK